MPRLVDLSTVGRRCLTSHRCEAGVRVAGQGCRRGGPVPDRGTARRGRHRSIPDVIAVSTSRKRARSAPAAFQALRACSGPAPHGPVSQRGVADRPPDRRRSAAGPAGSRFEAEPGRHLVHRCAQRTSHPLAQAAVLGGLVLEARCPLKRPFLQFSQPSRYRPLLLFRVRRLQPAQVGQDGVPRTSRPGAAGGRGRPSGAVETTDPGDLQPGDVHPRRPRARDESLQRQSLRPHEPGNANPTALPRPGRLHVLVE